ncbi:MAG: alpha-rhamnosidase [Chitinophagaceae bacterium]|nr:MAG: alpha-rhamnosidase [Chitinophagaceae bacterium]
MKGIIKTISIVSTCLLVTACAVSKDNAVEVKALTVEGRSDLAGSDLVKPRLSWKLQGNERDLKQTAYQVLVASSSENLEAGKGDLWDSGLVQGETSLDIPYAGNQLSSYQHCYWKVRVVTNKEKERWSAAAEWSVGLLDSSDWKAKWIGLDGFSEQDQPDSTFTRLAARYLRKEFSIDKKILSATAYISGLGLYELYINGKKAGNDVLAPTVSEYNKRIFYNTYDVTSLVKNGNNCAGVILGNGRYFGMRNYHGKPDPLTQIPQVSYGLPRLLVQVRIAYTDGSSSWLKSDESWKVTDKGPILANSEFDGEEYDARREMTGWSEVGFTENNWQPVSLMPPPTPAKIVSQPNEGIRIKETLKPISVKATTRGTYIVDMGQNMVGWLAVRVKGQAGDTIKMRFAETMKGTDSIYLANMRNAQVTDKYILKGTGAEQWEPRFTYHGFRYVEITGLRAAPALTDLEGKVIYDDVETTGTFKTSDSTINSVFKNAYWTIRGNYRGMPTDCPQRDERVGWMGDRVISSYGESFLFDNSRLYAKWLDDINDSQKENGSIPDIAPTYWDRYADNVTYPSAFILIPEMLRKQFGDTESLKKQYPAMKKWILYMWNTYRENDLVLKDNYGDWCVPPERLDMIWSNDPTRITEGGLLASAYYFYCLNLMTRYATTLGNTADAENFRSVAGKVQSAFNKKYYNSDKKSYANNTVTANLLPLTFGLVPEQDKAAVFTNIKNRLKEFDNHVNSGIIGGMWLMRGLTDNGAADLAYTIATNKTYPSWGYMVGKGATTIWELWNGDAANPMMNSGNHQMLLGDLLIWYYEYLAGIKTDDREVAFKKVLMNPIFPDGLDFVDASLDTKYGLVKSSWKKTAGGLEWEITIPPNASAAVYFPASDAAAITEGGTAIEGKMTAAKSPDGKDRLVLSIGSGSYKFVVKNK